MGLGSLLFWIQSHPAVAERTERVSHEHMHVVISDTAFWVQICFAIALLFGVLGFFVGYKAAQASAGTTTTTRTTTSRSEVQRSETPANTEDDGGQLARNVQGSPSSRDAGTTSDLMNIQHLTVDGLRHEMRHRGRDPRGLLRHDLVAHLLSLQGGSAGAGSSAGD